MYLHAGNHCLIRKRNIIGIFDMDTSTISATTRKYLSQRQKRGAVITLNDDVPRSFILTDDGKIYLSILSSSALSGRASGI